MTVTRSVTRSATRSATYGATVGKWGGEPAWMRPFALAFDFVNGVYRLNGGRVSWPVIDGYHTRTSGRRAEFIDGRSQEYANGVMALTNLGYDSREGWTVRNANSLTPRSWTASGASASNASGDYLGLNVSSAVASTGSTADVVTDAVSSGLTSATVYNVRVRYVAGSSGRARVRVANVTAGTESVLSGVAGALASSSTGAGAWSGVTNTNLGGGIFEVSATFTSAATGASANIAVGPDSATAGQDVVVIAAQITQTSYPMPFGVGTVAPDSLVIPAADAGLAVDPSVTGLTMVWRGRDFPSAIGFPKIMEIRVDGSNRATMARNGSSGDVLFTFGKSGATGQTSGAATASACPYGDEYTFVAVWRADGTAWLKAGPAPVFTRTGVSPLSAPLTALNVGGGAVGTEQSNSQTRIAAIGAFALSDADALNLFNAVAGS